jgi:hypothetical protein
MFRPHTVILSCYRILSSRSCCSVMLIFAYVMFQPCASPDVLIVSVRLLEYLCCLCGRHVDEDGRVRPKHVLIQFKK